MAGGFFYLKIRVDRVVSGEEWIRKIRDEIDQLVLEMNQTAERNVALLENRVKALQDLLQDADRKLKVLKNESDKNDISRQLYTHLKKQTPPQVPEEESSEETTVDLTARSSEGPLFDAALRERNEAHEKQAPALKDQVMELYGQGFSAEIISQKLGASISEVDLIINLNTGGRS
jgi:hypothetical protein